MLMLCLAYVAFSCLISAVISEDPRAHVETNRDLKKAVIGYPYLLLF